MRSDLLSTPLRERRLRDLLEIVRNIRAGMGMEGILDLFDQVKLEEVPSFIDSIKSMAALAGSVDTSQPATLEAVIDQGVNVLREFSEVTTYERDDEWAETLAGFAGPSPLRTTLVEWLAKLIDSYLAAKASAEPLSAARFDAHAELSQVTDDIPTAAAINWATLIDLLLMLFELWRSTRGAAADAFYGIEGAR